MVAALVRGKPVGAALNILRFTKRAAAKPVAKLIQSAVANADRPVQGPGRRGHAVREDHLGGPGPHRSAASCRAPWAAPPASTRRPATFTWCSPTTPRSSRRLSQGDCTWVRKFIRSGSASASSGPGTRKWFEHKNYAKWLHEDIRIREFVKKSLGHAGVSQGRDRARREQGEGQRPHRASGHRHRQARRGHRDGQEGPPEVHRERGLPQHRRGPQGRDRRAAGGREHRHPARAPHRLPPRDEEGHPDRDEVRRQGHPRGLLRPPRRRGDGALRVVPRGPGAAAHAPRRHRLRLRRGQDHLRQDRLQGVDLPRRGAPEQGRQAPARRRSSADGVQEHSYEDTDMLQPARTKYRKMQKGRMPGRPTAAATSPSASSA